VEGDLLPGLDGMDVIEPTSRQEERNILQLSTETEINVETPSDSRRQGRTALGIISWRADKLLRSAMSFRELREGLCDKMQKA